MSSFESESHPLGRHFFHMQNWLHTRIFKPLGLFHGSLLIVYVIKLSHAFIQASYYHY